MHKTIETLLNPEEYTHKQRELEEVHKCGNQLYKQILNKHKGFDPRIEKAYEGFESFPNILSRKKPNITRIWNLPFFGGQGFLYGSSMGHLHPKEDFETQEIYEFLSYGAMLIATDEKASLHICKPQDKIIVPPNCIMTMLNLSNQTLETIDMANPLENQSSKDILKTNKGPMIALYHSGYSPSTPLKEQTFKMFNYNIPVPTKGKINFLLNPKYPVFEINQEQIFEFQINEKPESLYKQIQEKKENFKYFNIEIIQANPLIKVHGKKGTALEINSPLIKLVNHPDKPIHKLLGIIK